MKQAINRNHPIIQISRSFLLLLTFTTLCVSAQERKLEYSIKRNGDVVGNIHFIQGIAGNRTVLTMKSEVNTHIIFNFKTNAKEEAIYDNGIMTWSSIFREQNGNVKIDKKTKVSGNAYTVYKGRKTETLNNYPIRYNMLSIYISEPVNISRVYSDYFQQQIDIEKVADHHYKIKFPDGNYNEYFYTNGVCSKIEVHNSFYSATVELKS